MTITRTLTSLIVAAALAATAMGPVATAASADSWRGSGYSSNHGKRNWNNDHRYRYAYGHRVRRDRSGRIIALGLGALMLGIIASQAAHHHDRDGYYDDGYYD